MISEALEETTHSCPLSGIDLPCGQREREAARAEAAGKLQVAFSQTTRVPLTADFVRRLQRRATEELVPPRSAPGGTQEAASLLRQLVGAVGEAAGRERLEKRRTAKSQVALPSQEMMTVRLGSLVPHRNGLMDVMGRRVQWGRIKDPQKGLLPAMEGLGLHILGLPGVRVWEDFMLPTSLGFRLESWGGVSYHSVGILTPVGPGPGEESQTIYDLSTPTAVVMLVLDIVVVWFALHTSGSSEADAKWVIALREGAAAGVKAAERFQTRKILWLGDFNYQPAEVGPPMDPHQTRRTNWEIVTRELRMKVLNPSRTWTGEGPEDDWHMVQR